MSEVRVEDACRVDALTRAQGYAMRAQALLDPLSHAVGGAGLASREIYDALVVPCSARYLPLSEECMRGAHRDGDRWRFGVRSGARSREVERMYRMTGFAWRELAGDPCIVGSLRPDSLAVELAYVAWLLRGHEGAGVPSDEGSELERLADQFVARHVLPFVRKAVQVGAETGASWLRDELEACRRFVEADAACVA